MKGWEKFEAEAAEALGLSRTISSGSKFHDPGDAVSRGRNNPFPLYADAKYTELASYSLKLRDLRQYSERATEQGKRFVMPLRFDLKGDVTPEDYLVMGLHDFAELLQLATGVQPPAHHELLTQEEEELLTEIAELAHPTPTRMRLLQLIDKLRGTEVA